VTHTYAILEVSAVAYEGVKCRLIEAVGYDGWWFRYRHENDGREIIVLGTVGLRAELIAMADASVDRTTWKTACPICGQQFDSAVDPGTFRQNVKVTDEMAYRALSAFENTAAVERPLESMRAALKAALNG